jgi:N-acetylmuramoyl-L-alanine amidase
MSDYTVRQGDCLSSIAAQHGFRDYRIIYDHPSNAALKAKRPNPNVVNPGDGLFIPEKEQKQCPAPTGKRTTFWARIPRTRLRLRLLDLRGNALGGLAFTLTVAGREIKGTTAGDGMIDELIPAHAPRASLLLDERGVTKELVLGALDPIDTVSGYQGRLKNLGYDPGPVDGVAGPRTAAAVRAFQRDNPPLRVDGVCDPPTQTVLEYQYGC